MQGPNTTERGISPSDATLQVIRTEVKLNIKGLVREEAVGVVALPTLFSPAHMNFKVQIANRSNILSMQSVTLWLPDFQGPISKSTVGVDLPMFQLDPGTRLCFINRCAAGDLVRMTLCACQVLLHQQVGCW